MRRSPHIFRTPAVLGIWAALVLVAGCQPTAGADCQTRSFACADEASALECRDEIWTEIPCRGPGGCAVEEGRVLCDMSLNQPGDPCPLTAEGQATCKTPELNAVLECRDGALVQTRTCSNCFGANELLTCEP